MENTATAANHATYQKLKATIDQSYPKGRFIAIDQGQIVANAADIAELERVLLARTTDPRNVLVVQAGYDYPEYVHIFLTEFPL